MFWKWRRLARHLQKHGQRAPATVVEIAKHGHEMRVGGSSTESKLTTVLPGPMGEKLAPSSGWFSVRKTKLRVRPGDGPEFEMEQDIRYGDWGREVPEAGDEIDVIYDPEDHEKMLVAPPTDEEEAIQIAENLGKADIGITLGGGGAKPAPPKPVSDEQLASHQKEMDQAASMLEQAQQFMPGLGQGTEQKKDEE